MSSADKAQRFRNILVSMMNIDLHELVVTGVIKEGNLDNGGSSWARFNKDPLVFVAKLGDKELEALWALVAARQKPSDDTFAAGIEAAASFINEKCAAYIEEHGMFDPSTNETEYPGTGDEYVAELEELAEEICALTKARVQS